MKYLNGLAIRALLSLMPISVFSFIFTPITLYGSYLLLIFYNPLVYDRFLVVGGIPYEFVEACIVSVAYYLLWVLCLLTKDIAFRIRLKIVIYGFLLILAMNLIRIFIIIVAATEYGFYWFNIIHLTFWYFVSGVYVAFVWIFLVKKYKIKSVPVYDDLKTLCKIAFRKKSSNL